eukprot:403358640
MKLQKYYKTNQRLFSTYIRDIDIYNKETIAGNVLSNVAYYPLIVIGASPTSIEFAQQLSNKFDIAPQDVAFFGDFNQLKLAQYTQNHPPKNIFELHPTSPKPQLFSQLNETYKNFRLTRTKLEEKLLYFINPSIDTPEEKCYSFDKLIVSPDLALLESSRDLNLQRYLKSYRENTYHNEQHDYSKKLIAPVIDPQSALVLSKQIYQKIRSEKVKLKHGIVIIDDCQYSNEKLIFRQYTDNFVKLMQLQEHEVKYFFKRRNQEIVIDSNHQGNNNVFNFDYIQKFNKKNIKFTTVEEYTNKLSTIAIEYDYAFINPRLSLSPDLDLRDIKNQQKIGKMRDIFLIDEFETSYENNQENKQNVIKKIIDSL